MANTYKVFGQTGDASSEVDLYTVPALKQSKVKVSIANRAASDATYRVAIVPGGGLTGNENYIALDETVTANSSLVSEVLTLEAAAVVRVESSTSTVSFTAYGVEADL